MWLMRDKMLYCTCYNSITFNFGETEFLAITYIFDVISMPPQKKDRLKFIPQSILLDITI